MLWAAIDCQNNKNSIDLDISRSHATRANVVIKSFTLRSRIAFGYAVTSQMLLYRFALAKS